MGGDDDIDMALVSRNFENLLKNKALPKRGEKINK